MSEKPIAAVRDVDRLKCRGCLHLWQTGGDETTFAAERCTFVFSTEAKEREAHRKGRHLSQVQSCPDVARVARLGGAI
jgi:hypothetical protein